MSVSFSMALRARMHRYVNQDSVIKERKNNFRSEYLNRKVVIDIFLPPHYFEDKEENYKVLYFNDGQDMPAVKLAETLEELFFQNKIEKIIVVAIHTGKQRMQEYGTAAMPDFAKRGSQAENYMKFMLGELIPFINTNYQTLKGPENTAFAGFSLGGLSALDISWNCPHYFNSVGVFSGSFWWRKKALDKGYTDADRIMHHIIRESEKREGMKFWFQTGTEDEIKDRNKNGIIDSIDDTLDLIEDLKTKGYRMNKDIRYLEIDGGKHNQETWGEALPDFLEWAFGMKL